ncbi:hypothetical protein ACYEXS_01475 [Paenibacillus sp. MAH-36]|uniref:Uncharacterized protein n=1 Tax=Paenibacillus violae TaxID=3077234 RepID=A0ABU3RH50_9BACL|nr:hypothetical protein [Paenibacillus sp. PFR10]
MEPAETERVIDAEAGARERAGAGPEAGIAASSGELQGAISAK